MRLSNRAPLASAFLFVVFLAACWAPLLASRHPILLKASGSALESPLYASLGTADVIWMGAGLLLCLWLGLVWRLRWRHAGKLVFLLAALIVVFGATKTSKNLAARDYAAEVEGGAWVLGTPVGEGVQVARIEQRLQTPSLEHWLGTDRVGRDVVAGLVHGARTSTLAGLGSVALALLVGALVGAMGGYLGGWPDRILSGCILLASCFPTLVLILGLLSFVQPSVFWVMIVIAVAGWPVLARLTRSEVQRRRNRPWVDVARTQGQSPFRIITSLLLPAAAGPVLIQSTLMVASAIILEATLAFLGFEDPSALSWGSLLRQGKESLDRGVHLIVFPGLTLVLVVLALHRIVRITDPDVENVEEGALAHE